jgi:hypothetical protein
MQKVEVPLQDVHPVFIVLLETSLKRILDVVEKVIGNMIRCSALLIPKLSIGHDQEPLLYN